jgi:hypothetical protein
VILLGPDPSVGASSLAGWDRAKIESAKKQEDHFVIRWSKKGGVNGRDRKVIGVFVEKGALRAQLSAKRASSSNLYLRGKLG